VSARYTVQTAVTFDAHEPTYLLVEWDTNGSPRCVGQFHKVEDAILYAHERRGTRPHLTVVEGRRKREPKELVAPITPPEA
jgi:hypothetical protein